jgi:hypothetical protein
MAWMLSKENWLQYEWDEEFDIKGNWHQIPWWLRSLWIDGIDFWQTPILGMSHKSRGANDIHSRLVGPAGQYFEQRVKEL